MEFHCWSHMIFKTINLIVVFFRQRDRFSALSTMAQELYQESYHARDGVRKRFAVMLFYYFIWNFIAS